MAGASLSVLVLAAPALADKWDPSLDGIGRAGSDSGGGALDLLVPLYQDDDTLLFGNALGGLDSDSSTGAALGLGLRLQIDESVILGGFAYGDWLRTQNDNAFFQVTGGLEVMTEDWDLRVIGYLPLTDERSVAYRAPVDGVDGAGGIGVGTGTLEVQGNELGIQWEGIAGSLGLDGFHEREALLGGFEGEIGYKLPLDRALGRNWEVRTFIGGYHFSAEDYDTYAGPRARVELRGYDLAFMGDGARVTLGAEASWDDPRGVTGAGLLRVRIPLGWFTNERKELTALDRRMVDPIPRRITPLTDSRTTTLAAVDGSLGGGAFEAVEDVETDREIENIAFASGTAGGNGTAADSGTQADPTDLDSAVTLAGTNGLVVVLGSEGSLTTQVDLLDGQIVLGGGSTLDVRGVISNTAFTYDPGDTRPTLIHDAAVAGTGVVQIDSATGVKIQGLSFNALVPNFGTQRFGVSIVDSSNGIVRDIDVTGGVAGLVVFDTGGAASDNFLGEDIDVTDASFGIIVQSVGTGRLTNLEFDGATGNNIANQIFQVSGAVAGDSVNGISINDVTGTTPGGGVIFANSQNIVVSNFNVGAAAPNVTLARGFSLNAGVSNVTLTDSSFTNYATGILASNSTNVTIDNVTITDAQSFGIQINDGSDIDITNSTIIDTGIAASAAISAGLQINGVDGVLVQNVAIIGGNQTDNGFNLQALTPGVGSIVFKAGSTGNTVTGLTGTGAACATITAGGAIITGSLSYDNLDDGAGVVTCP